MFVGGTPKLGLSQVIEGLASPRFNENMNLILGLLR